MYALLNAHIIELGWLCIRACATTPARVVVRQLARLTAAHAAPPISQDGTTPLYCAAEQGKLDVCQFLVASGADVHKRNSVTLRDESGPSEMRPQGS